jgi:hypothetical protein
VDTSKALFEELGDEVVLALWLDGAHGIRLDNQSRVVQWQDRREGLQERPRFEQADAQLRPVPASSPAAVSFGGAHVLAGTDVSLDEFTVFTVVRHNAPPIDGLLLSNCDDDGSSFGNNRFGFSEDNLGRTNLLFFGRYVAVGPTTYSVKGVAEPTSEWQIVTLVKSRAQGVRILQDGVDQVSSEAPAPHEWVFDRIGAWCPRDGKPSAGLDGEVAELLVFDRVLSGEQVGKVESYLRDKYELW